MCFASEVIKRLGWNAFSLTENWEYYVLLALDGYVVTPEEDARIYSQVATSLRLGETQRIRWLKGRLDTLTRYGRRLIREVLIHRDVAMIDVLLELARPSHAMLFLHSFAYAAICAVATLWGGGEFAVLLQAAVLILLLQIVYGLSGLAILRPSLRTWLALAMMPKYLLWKALVSAKAIGSRRDQRWIGTSRNTG
jgi:hypothetical protein